MKWHPDDTQIRLLVGAICFAIASIPALGSAVALLRIWELFAMSDQARLEVEAICSDSHMDCVGDFRTALLLLLGCLGIVMIAGVGAVVFTTKRRRPFLVGIASVLSFAIFAGAIALRAPAQVLASTGGALFTALVAGASFNVCKVDYAAHTDSGRKDA